MFEIPAPAARRARRLDAARHAAQHRLQHDPPVVGGVGHHLVAGYERERHDRLEVPARQAVDGGQIAPADAGQPGPDADPAGAGQLDRVDVGQAQWPHHRAAAGRHGAGDMGRHVLQRLAVVAEGLHRGALARSRQTGPIGSSGRGPPDAFSQCSTSQPRLRASAASRVSGLTATGKPTASSMGRSDDESA